MCLLIGVHSCTCPVLDHRTGRKVHGLLFYLKLNPAKAARINHKTARIRRSGILSATLLEANTAPHWPSPTGLVLKMENPIKPLQLLYVSPTHNRVAWAAQGVQCTETRVSYAGQIFVYLTASNNPGSPSIQEAV
jgi:hypothetical protein